MLISSYFTFLQLGAFNGLNRNLAFYKAQEKHEKVQQQVNASFQVAKWVALIGLFVGLAILLWFTTKSFSKIHTYSAIALTIVLFCTPFNSHFSTTYRSGKEFKSLGKIIFLQNTLFGLLSLTSAFLGYLGKIISDIGNSIFGLFLRYRNQPQKANSKGNFVEIKELIQVGFPLLVSGYLLTLFQIADQSIIALKLGSEALGYYTISKLILAAVPVIPTTLSVLLYPRASAQYAITKNNKGLRSFYFKSLFINLIVVIPICILLYILIPFLVKTFLPNYIPGINSARINILTCMTFVYVGPSIIIGVVKRNIPYICFVFFVFIVFWASLILKPSLTESIERVALFRFCLSTLLCVLTLIYCYYLTTIKEYNA